jgi:hypothetical protein
MENFRLSLQKRFYKEDDPSKKAEIVGFPVLILGDYARPGCGCSQSYPSADEVRFIEYYFSIPPNFKLTSKNKFKFAGMDPKPSVLDGLLQIASRQSAIIFGHMREQHGQAGADDLEIGSILPALYYLAREFFEKHQKEGRSVNWDDLNAFALSDPKYIRSLIACALRKKSSQINFSEPQYQFGLSEVGVQQLIDSVTL